MGDDVTSDRWLVRLVGITVCVAALLAVLSIAVGAYREVEIPDSIDRLGYLLAGGLLGALTTRLTGEPVEVVVPDGQPLAVVPVTDAGHGDLLLLIVVAAAVILAAVVLTVLRNVGLDVAL